MRLDENTIRRNEKIYTFLGAYFVLMALRMMSVFVALPAVKPFTAAVLFFAVTAVVISMGRRKVFHSKIISVFLSGLIVWLAWGVANAFAGTTMFSAEVAKEFLTLVVFMTMIFAGSKITIKYNLRKYLLRITLVTIGTALVTAYIVRFDGFAFIGSITKIFTVGERYRNSYGFFHANFTGILCFYFFALKAIYNCELKRMRIKSDVYSVYFSLIAPVIAIVLLSTASRASITTLILFWMFYYFVISYQKTGKLTKIMFVTMILSVMGIIIMSVDWELVYRLSGRAVNYITVLPLLTSSDAWITGIGFTYGDEMFNIIGIDLLDSFYLFILLQSGIVGCVLYFGSVAYFARGYFRDIKSMTKLHILVGGLFVSAVYYGLFERSFFGHSLEVNIIAWILFITTLDERDRKTSRQQRNLLHNS